MSNRRIYLVGLVFIFCAANAKPDEARMTFSAEDYKPLKGVKGLAWPKAKAFEKTWKDGAENASPVQLIRADLNGLPNVVLSVIPVERGYALSVLFGPDRAVQRSARSALQKVAFARDSALVLKSGAVDRPGEAVFQAESSWPDDGTLRLKIHYVAPKTKIPGYSWRDWVYVSALQNSDPPVDKEFTAPTGLCSRDLSPLGAMRDYAERCLEQGRLGCFLQLQTRLIADRYPSRAYSSFGERAHDTDSKALIGLGIDGPKYFRGLLYRFITPGQHREESGTFRLARAIAEFGPTKTMRAMLRDMAQDSRLDEFNRLRATQILYGVYRRSFEKSAGLRTLKIMKQLDLAPLSKTWLATFE